MEKFEYKIMSVDSKENDKPDGCFLKRGRTNDICG